MICFNHPDEVSVGLCAICYKGICHSCACFGIKKIVCSEACAKEEEMQWKITEWSRKYITQRQYIYTSLIFLLVALSILAPIGYDYFWDNKKVDFSLLMIGGTLLVGAFGIYKSHPK